MGLRGQLEESRARVECNVLQGCAEGVTDDLAGGFWAGLGGLACDGERTVEVFGEGLREVEGNGLASPAERSPGIVTGVQRLGGGGFPVRVRR